MNRHGNAPVAVLELAAALFLLYLVGECAVDARYRPEVRLAVPALAIAGLVWPALRTATLFWGGVTLVLLWNLIAFYASAANHHFLTLYAAGFFFGDALLRRRDEASPINVARALMIVVFGFASLQKLLSAYFMSGRLVATYFLSRQSLHPMLSRLFDNYGVGEYGEAYQAVSNGALLGTATMEFSVGDPAFWTFCRLIAVSIVAAEVIVFLGLVVRRIFYHRWFPALMYLFVWGTFLFRQEIFFFALLCTLFLAARPDMSQRWRRLYAATTVFFLAFGIAGWRTLF